MGTFDSRRTNNWLRLMTSLGLMLADSKIRNNFGKEVRHKVDSVTDAIADRYEDAVDRLESAVDALHGRNPWPGRAGALLLGVGIGAGLGIMLAPASGDETRRNIRERTSDLKNRVVENTRMRATTSSMPSTGTEG